MPFRPYKACDATFEQLRFPLVGMPKLDGVRAIYADKFLGRSLKPHANVNLNAYFNAPQFSNFDGELTVGSISDGATCRRTTSAVRQINGPGHEVFTWHVFDIVVPSGVFTHYFDRLMLLQRRVHDLNDPHLKVVPWNMIENIEQARELHAQNMAAGYEGTILRDPDGYYKQGRSTVIEGGFLRIKDFVIEEARVLEIHEGLTNNNEALVNELGYTSRQTLKENMAPSGMLGYMICLDLKTKQQIKVAPGCMTHDQRKRFLKNPAELLNSIIQYRTMKYGVKDKPRFPTFFNIRTESDIDPELLT